MAWLLQIQEIMQHVKIHSARQNSLLTGALIAVTVVLWIYLIATLVQSRQGLHISYLPSSEVLRQEAMSPMRALPQRLPPGAERAQRDERALLDQEYRRFVERDENFARRLNNDERFLLENSF